MSEMTAEVGAARDSIRSRIRELGPALKGTRSVAMIAVLAGAALWPVAAPFLGTTAALSSLSAAIGLLGGPGSEYLSAVLKQWTTRHSGSQDAGVLQTDLERRLLEGLEANSAEAAALRADVSRLLQEVGAVDTALSASAPDVREALARGLAEMSERWDEFRWMLSDLRDLLVAIQAKQAESVTLQRHQLDLQREQLVKTNLLLRVRTPETEGPPAEDEEAEAPADVPCPYKGLEAFQAEDAGLFFGREELVAELLARLAERPFLAVVGASGSGKSSVVRAGLVPALWEGALSGSASWRVIVMTPGDHPLRELAARLSLLRGLAAGSLLDDLSADPARLDLAIRQALVDEPEDARVVLVIDQLEEAVTLCATRTSAARS